MTNTVYETHTHTHRPVIVQYKLWQVELPRLHEAVELPNLLDVMHSVLYVRSSEGKEPPARGLGGRRGGERW